MHTGGSNYSLISWQQKVSQGATIANQLVNWYNSIEDQVKDWLD